MNNQPYYVEDKMTESFSKGVWEMKIVTENGDATNQ